MRACKMVGMGGEGEDVRREKIFMNKLTFSPYAYLWFHNCWS